MYDESLRGSRKSSLDYLLKVTRDPRTTAVQSCKSWAPTVRVWKPPTILDRVQRISTARIVGTIWVPIPHEDFYFPINDAASHAESVGTAVPACLACPW